jgi:hypothetical protein
MREPVILDQLLDRALRESDYHAKRARFATRKSTSSAVKRGMGVAAFYHGSGFTGSGERYLNSLAGVDVTPEGKVRVLVSNTEFGQGTNTILTQIAAEAIGIDYDDVIMAPADTGMFPTAARPWHRARSMVVGRLIERAGLQLLPCCASMPDWASTTRAKSFLPPANAIAPHGEVVSLCRYEAPPGIFWDDQKYRGEAYPAYAWSIHDGAGGRGHGYVFRRGGGVLGGAGGGPRAESRCWRAD